VDVVGHDDEDVELIFARVAVAEERGDEQFGDGGALEDAASLVGDRGECVGLGFESQAGVSRGLKPREFCGP
jgi:hypothetical protein